MTGPGVEGGTVLTGAPTVVAEVLDGEAVLFDERTGAVCALSATATEVWVRLDGRATVDGVVEALERRYTCDPGVLHADVVAVVADLARSGFVVPRPGPSAPAPAPG